MVYLKSPAEIQIMREGGKILAEIIKKLSDEVKPGITTKDIDKLMRELILFYKVKPAFLGYGGFPASVCTSINDEVVHCVPSERRLEQGQIISLDMGIIHGGFNLDAAITMPVLGNLNYWQWAKLNSRLHQLIEVTREALCAGIKEAKVGNNVGKIGHAIQLIVEKHKFGVVRDLVGHGIGRKLHEEPHVPNFGSPDDGIKLEEGMVIAIEPITTVGDWRVIKGRDGFTYKTKDGSYAAHFEHTVAITKKGPRILTLF